ncbi:hypothetical protein [Corynebacterium nasicanis]|uniref:Type II toxin-antitoxin system HicA family toxin n=1 Tax=Corynebacterium nasicanis TaxID=1448267 RepID=A0ABW1QE30_9CORY
MDPHPLHGILSGNFRLAVLTLLTLAVATSRFLPSPAAAVLLGLLTCLTLSLLAVLWWLRDLIRQREKPGRCEPGELEDSPASPPSSASADAPLAVEELDAVKLLLQRQLGGTVTVLPADVRIGPGARRFLHSESLSWPDIHAQLDNVAHHDTPGGDHRFLLPDLEIFTDPEFTFVKYIGYRAASPAAPGPPGASRSQKQRRGSRVPGTKHDPRLPVPTTRGDLIRRLRARGFQVTQGRKHTKITHPDYPSRSVTMPSSPSDRRWIHNNLRDIRHEFGIDLRSPQQ